MKSRNPTTRSMLSTARAAGIAFTIAATTATLIAVCITIAWQQGPLKRWVQARAVEYALKQIQPHLPFEIEELEVDTSFLELWHGHLKNLSAVLRWEELRLRIQGPIDVTRPGGKNPDYTVKLNARATIEPVSDSTDRSTSFDVSLYGSATRAPEQLTDLELHLSAPEWAWPEHRLTLDLAAFSATWKNGALRAAFDSKRLGWAPSNPENTETAKHAILTDIHLEARTPLTLKPFLLGPEAQLSAKASDAKIAWNLLRLHLPLNLLPLRAKLDLGAPSTGDKTTPTPSPHIQKITATAGPAQLSWSDGLLKWKLPALPLKIILPEVLRISHGSEAPYTLPAWIGKIDLRKGSIESEGEINLPSRQKPLKAQGIARIHDGAFQLSNHTFAARGIELNLPFSTQHGAQGAVSATDLYFRGAHAQLDLTEVSLVRATPEILRIRLGSSGRDGKPAQTPLRIDGVPLTAGPITGDFRTSGHPERAPDARSSFEIQTSLKIPPVAVEKIAHPFCIKNHANWPPATIEADLAKITFAPGTVDPDGSITARLFDGAIRAQEVGLFDLDSPVPEVDFDLDFEGLQLNQLCNWSGFGEMTGTLQGFAHGVTFQGWLPTHFDFSFDAIPRPPSTWIEMDPEAMHNLVSLFAGDALEHVPVIAHGGLFNKTFDPYFGWISRRLGGFDLKYLGLSLYSTNGAILLETHDLPEIFRIMKKHYIFWGHRFKMPVQSDHYPVVMDEHGVARIFQFMVERAKAIAQAKRAGKTPPHLGPVKESQQNTHENAKDDADAENKQDDPSCRPPLLE